jgi:hypothetical protein
MAEMARSGEKSEYASDVEGGIFDPPLGEAMEFLGTKLDGINLPMLYLGQSLISIFFTYE